MKKRILLVLIFMLSVVASFGIIVSATSNVVSTESEAVITVEELCGNPGKTVDMDLVLTENPGILGATITVSWDESLTLISDASGDAFNHLTYTSPSRYDASGTNFVWYGNEVQEAIDGTVLTLTFKVSEAAQNNDILPVRVSYTHGDVVDKDENDVTLSITDGHIRVITYQPGDVTGDGRVNARDLVRLSQYISDGCETDPEGYNAEVVLDACDVNSDGRVNARDLIRISRYISDGGQTNPDGYNVVLEPSKIPQCEHIEVIDEAVLPTCTTTGLTEGSHCSACNKVIKKQDIIQATGHTYIEGVCHCGTKDENYDENFQYSEGLEYYLSVSGKNYVVEGIGQCKDKDIIIPPEYNGLPVTGIRGGAFAGNTEITSITFPDTFDYIGDYAFRDCTGLTTINIPKNITRILPSAFSGCYNITSYNVHKDNIVYHSADNCIIETQSKTLLFGCQKSVIPTDGSVTQIGDYAFKGCSNLQKLVIPNSVTSIGYAAFSGCSGLSEIRISDNLATIKAGAFSGCEKISSLALPDNLIEIASQAFMGCKSLKALVIPINVTTIGEYAFSNCNSLETISVVNGNAFYHDENNCLIETQNKTLLLGCKNSIIPNDGSVTSIGNSAFKGCSDLSSILIPSSITVVERSAFEGCTSLESIQLPDGILSIEGYTFKDCINLSQIILPDSVQEIDTYSFYNCIGLEKFTIPASVTIIQTYTFEGCDNLKELTLSTSIETIEIYAFMDLLNLTKINYLGTEQQWNQINKESRWDYNTGGISVVFNYNETPATEYTVIFKDYDGTVLKEQTVKSGESVIAPVAPAREGYKFVGWDKAFDQVVGDMTVTAVYDVEPLPDEQECEHIEVIDKAVAPTCENSGLTEGSHCSVCGVIFTEQSTIPALGHNFDNRVCTNCGEKEVSQGLSFTPIDSDTCYVSGMGSCTDSELIIPSVSPDGQVVVAIKSYAFRNKSKLVSVTIPNSINIIENNAFMNCVNLTQVIFENNSNLKYIERQVFESCGALKSISLPEGLISIGSYAFTECTSLGTVYIPNTVIEIEGAAFCYCSNLTNIDLPDGLTQISSDLFFYCEQLTNIKLPSNITEIGAQAFLGCSNLKTVNIPDGITKIGDSAFSNCKNLTSIEMPNGVSEIGDNAFKYCENLISINLPSGLAEISARMFYYCKNLTNIDLPSGITKIGEYAFYGCDKLADITVPEGVVTIDSYAFGFCRFQHIYLPSSLSNIKEHAFFACTKLTTIEYNGTPGSWNAISKENEWNDSISNVTIVCRCYHNVTSNIEGFDANCIDAGLTDGEICLVCGKVVIAQEPIPAFGHNMQNNECIVCGFDIIDYTNISQYHSDYGYQSIGNMKNGANLQAFYRAMDEALTAFHLNTNLNLSIDSKTGRYVVADINYAKCGISVDEAKMVQNIYMCDHPLYYWISTWIGWNYKPSCLRIYTESDYALGSDRAAINAIIYEEVANYDRYIHGENDAYSITLATYEWIAKDVTYAYDKNGDAEEALWAHRVTGYFLGKNVVCEGYAQTLQLLLNFVGVENIVVDGDSNGAHCWNLIKLDDGEWYWADLTWDDSSSTIMYNYFCVNDTQFVDWYDELYGMNDNYEGSITFLDEHTPYDINYSNPLYRLYDLPERSSAKFSVDDVLELRECFTVNGYTYALTGYETVQLVYIEGVETAVVSNYVVHNNKVYAITSIGAINEKGYFSANDFATSNEVKKIFLLNPSINVWENALENSALEEVVLTY